MQDAAEWWDLILDATHRALSSGAVDAGRIEAVSVTGQWASTVPVDEAGIPVGDCQLWMDSRGEPYAAKVIAGPVSGYAPVPLALWVRRTGGAPSTTGADPIGHMLHLIHDEPEVARATRWYLEPVDYLSMRFTGAATASHASMTAAWLTDNRALDRMSYDPELVRRAGLSLRELPPLRPTGSVVGVVAPKLAAELGLRDDVQVVTGTPDLHSGAVGAGTVLDYETHLAISTSSWLGCAVPFKKTDIFHQIATVPGLTPDRYLVANNHETGGACLQWLRDQVIAPDDGLTDSARPPDVRAAHRGRRGRPTRGRRDPLHAVALRRAVTRRRPQRARRVSQPLAGHHPRRSRRARCSKASRTTAAGSTRPSRSSPNGGWTTCA